MEMIIFTESRVPLDDDMRIENRPCADFDFIFDNTERPNFDIYRNLRARAYNR